MLSFQEMTGNPLGLLESSEYLIKPSPELKVSEVSLFEMELSQDLYHIQGEMQSNNKRKILSGSVVGSNGNIMVKSRISCSESYRPRIIIGRTVKKGKTKDNESQGPGGSSTRIRGSGGCPQTATQAQ